MFVVYTLFRLCLYVCMLNEYVCLCPSSNISFELKVINFQKRNIKITEIWRHNIFFFVRLVRYICSKAYLGFFECSKWLSAVNCCR